MTCAELTSRFPIKHNKQFHFLKTTLILCVVFYFLLSRIYNIESRFGFDHDQEIAADSAWNLIHNHRISLIGIETSRGGIFAGPLLNWTHTPFLIIWNFDPIALASQAILANLVLLTLLFNFVRKISNITQATIATIIYAASPRMLSYDISGSPISYMNLHTMLTIYFYHKIVYENKKNRLIALGLIIGLGYHIHVFLLFSIIPVIFLLWRNQIIKTRFDLAKLLIFFNLPMLSALVFDLKHDFLMSKNALSLIQNSSKYDLLQILQVSKTLFALLADTIIQINQAPPLFILPLAIVAIHVFFKKNDKIYKDLLIFIFAPCILLLLYKGPITEYYLISSAIPFIVLASFCLFKIFKLNKYFFLFIVIILAIVNTNTIISKFKNPHSLKVKKQMFEYILKTSNSEQVSITYNLPKEYNFGFTYLAKWYKILENTDARYKYLVEHDTKPVSINEHHNNSPSIMFGYFKLSTIK